VATAYDAAGNPCDNSTFTWSSSNSGLAAIDANGVARGVGAGSVVISARTGTGTLAKTGTAALVVEAATVGQSTRVSVIPGYAPVAGRPTSPGYAAFDREPDGSGPADGLFVDPLQMVLVRGESRPLDFRAVRGGDGQNAGRVPIVFTVDPGGERIIAVDSLGVVTSLSDAGTASVRLTVPGQQRIQPKLVRVEVRADSLRFNKVEFSMTPGTGETLSVFIPAQSRALNPGGLFQFTSSDPAKVRVNPVNPVVDALAPGTVRIAGQSSIYPEISATVHVHRRVTRLRLEPADTMRTIAIGGRTTVRAIALADDSSPVPEAPITWRSLDSSIVFDSATGQARGRRSGTATIAVSVPTVGVEAITRFVHVRVVAGGLRLPRTRLGIGVGEHLPLDVQLLDDQRNPVGSANSYLNWTAAPDTVARVDNNEIIALKPGHAVLTGRAGWDSTITVDLFVVGDMLVMGQYQGHGELLMKWNNGQNFTPLTHDSTIELQAAWSPDLTRILFAARPPVLPPGRRNMPEALYLIRSDGTGRVKLTDDTTVVRFPSFIDDNHVVFDWNAGSRFPQVWTGELRHDSLVGLRQVTALTPGAPNTAPAASRDGRRLAYISLRETSPGSHVVYGLYQANIDGTDERLKTAAPGGQRLEDPVYSADGHILYFLRSEAGRPGGQRVYRVAAEGADTAVAVTPPGMFVSSFSVSGDGNSLALATLEQAQGNAQPAQHVMIYDIASGQSHSIDAPGEVLSSPMLRPATPRPAAAPAR
jgi:Tol biopolymer transport system component/uncharacterized protein YjdB